jgi:hypothetical protein
MCASDQSAPRLLASYVIASADMRFIERSEREIYIRGDAENEYIIRGEMPGCGATCFASLGQVLLEFVMSCEGCVDPVEQAESVDDFCDMLGRACATWLNQHVSGISTSEQLHTAMTSVCRSLIVPFAERVASDKLSYSFVENPLEKTASSLGMNRAVELAQRGLNQFVSALTSEIAPDWVLIQPEVTDPLEFILTPAGA